MTLRAAQNNLLRQKFSFANFTVLFKHVFNLRCGIVAYKEDTFFISEVLDAIWAQLYCTSNFVGAGPHNLQRPKRLKCHMQKNIKIMVHFFLFFSPHYACSRKVTYLCVVATNLIAAVLLVAVVFYFIHPSLYGFCCIKLWWWIGCPYVFSHREKDRVHAGSIFEVNVVIKYTALCPRFCSNG